MNPTQTQAQLFAQAVALAQSGQKDVAYKQLVQLANAGFTDSNLFLWLAFTTNNLAEADRAIIHATQLDPNNPNLPEAKSWFAKERAKQPPLPKPTWQFTKNNAPKPYGHICVRCNRQFRYSYELDYKDNRCKDCKAQLETLHDEFRKAFLEFCSDGVLTEEEWYRLITGANQRRLIKEEVLSYISDDAVNFLERTLSFAASDGEITYQEEEKIKFLAKILEVKEQHLEKILDRIETIRRVQKGKKKADEIKASGSLPIIKPNIIIESDEFCHFEMQAIYHKPTTRNFNLVEGRLIATSKKLLFLSPDAGGTEILWKTVARVELEEDRSCIYLELTKKAGNGRYTVEYPHVAELIINMLARKANYQLLTNESGQGQSRHIPHNVKVEVWQRDGGKCVQCKATSYLEFDHIIPHSKGGANTVNNVQLLCRNCNLEKSDRI